jgi:16S rRNA (uracil1498-N3)-methyltransferase
VVQKLTELGIDHLVPFLATRSVVRWEDDRAARHHERLQRVAREASMQSRRCYLPSVAPLTPFAELVARPGMALADRDGRPPTAAISGALIGPEGGWTSEERAAAGAAGAPVLDLAEQVLRAETAAFAAAALLAALRRGLVRPAAAEEIAS